MVKFILLLVFVLQAFLFLEKVKVSQAIVKRQ